MNLSDKIEALAHKDDRNDGAKAYTCTPCGKYLEGRWHHCSKCHLTFPQEQGFVRHREGDYHPGPRTCRTAEALAADGWKHDPEGDVWRLPDPKKKEQNAS